MDKITFGSPDNTWQKYNLSENPIFINNVDTEQKAILRNGQLITIVSNQYQLLPNEEAVRIADTVCKSAGLVPFNKFSGDWVTTMKGKPHATTYGKNKASVHAMYALNESYEVEGDKMYMGIAIFNSIDASKAFGIGAFTFRKACSNMVLVAGKRNWKFFYHAGDNARTLEYVWKRHTKSLDPTKAKLSMTIADVVDYALGIKRAYDEMAVTKVTEELLKKITGGTIPKKVLPEWVQEEEIDITQKTVTQWELYNDITENIWHSENNQFARKLDLYNRLHKVMPVVR